MTLRKVALLVGIDNYRGSPLGGCVNDARTIHTLLAHNEDGSPNFHCVSLLAPRSTASSDPALVTKATLRRQFDEILTRRVDMALFYFAGHGTVSPRGGILVTQDTTSHDEGVAMAEIVDAANRSDIQEITIIVDACFSGRLGGVPSLKDDYVLLREGVAIIAASLPNEGAAERDERGVFTSVICGALEGGASDVMGEVTSASIYAYAEQALGPLDQRPMYKSNVARLSPLRTCRPVVQPMVLRKLKDYFPTAEHNFPLDPAYEPDHTQHPPGTTPDPAKEAIFAELQRCRDARLLVPVGEQHLFYAAIRSKSCRLTPLGKFYWKRANAGLL